MRRGAAQHFRPEFLNRVDEIVVFTVLNRAQLKRIIDIQLERLRRLLADRKDHAGVERRRQGSDRRRGLRPGLRRPPAQARHPAPHRRPAGPPDA